MRKFRSNMLTVVLFLGLALLYQMGCSSSDNPAGPDNNGDNNTETKNVETASQASVEINATISSFNQIAEFVGGPNAIAELDIPDFGNPSVAARFGKRIKARALRSIKKRPDVWQRAERMAVAGDSVVFDITERDSVGGVTYRVRLSYDSETDVARFFVVGFDYAEPHILDYDSTEVRAYLNGTLLNDSDDVLISLENLKRFKPGQLIKEEKGSFIPDAHAPGAEPDGGVLTNDITYSNSSFISKSSARFEYHEGSGGSYSKTSDFSDGTTHHEAATFNADGTGTFEETRRDGTEVSGTFDSAEEDGSGGYTLTTTFPPDHDPASISESGQFTFNVADSTINGTFEKEVTRLDGTKENESATITQNRVGDVLVTTINVENADGSSGFLTITESPDVDNVSGEWTNADGTFVVFTAQNYSDGSSHLEFQQYASEEAFENGVDPILTGEFDFYPDGSGKGVITEGDVVYDIIINPDGTWVITKRS